VRIVFLNPSGELGGAETALIELLAAVRGARPDWTLNLITSAAGPMLARVERLGVPVKAMEFPPALSRLGEWGRRESATDRVRLAAGAARAAVPVLSYTLRLRGALTQLAPDIVHTNGLKMHVLGAWCRPPLSKVVWHLHDYPDVRPLSATLLRTHVRRCSAIVANSTSVADRARQLLTGGPAVQPIYNALDLERFTPEGPALDLDALAGMRPLAANGIRVGLIGTFARWKGHEVFLRALAQVRSETPLRGYVIGDSIYRTDASQYSVGELRRIASSIGLNGNVGFTGHIADVPAALRSLDIVVHASVEPEPFGLVIAEAMACGRPVVVSHAGGAAEIAQGGAVFHTPGNATELAERIGQLVNEPMLRGALAKAGPIAAAQLFSRTRLAEALLPVYERIASERSTS